MTLARPILALSLLAVLAVPPLVVLAADETPVAPAPPAPPAPPPAAAPAPSDAERLQVQAMVDELREEAAKIRGLAWKFRVPADLVTRKQMREDFMSQIDVEYPPAKRERDTSILRRIGMLGPDQDIITLYMDFMEAGVAGYYDPKQKHLRIVEGLAGPEQKPTILHELVHALEDQYYDLEKRTKPYEEDGDRLFAEKCIVEGSAEHARALYEKAHPELAEVFARAQQNPTAAAAQMKAFAKVPAWMFVGTLLHYSKGPAFAARQVRGGAYPERIHALYEAPPVSQEQVLHPSRWFGARQDWPQKIECAGDLAKAAGEGWTLYHALPQGELDLGLALDFFLSPLKGKYNPITGKTPFPAAEKGARGWDGGMTWVLKKEGTPLVVVEAWAFDTPEDAWEAAEMMGRAAEKAAGKAWTSRGWQKEGEGPVPAKATLAYVNQHGASRLLLDGTKVLRVDGAPVEVLEALWPTVLATRFVKDPRDTWQPQDEGQELKAAGWADEEAGIGLTPPSAVWTVRKGGANQRALATVVHGELSVTVQLTVIGQEVPVTQLIPMIAADVRKGFPAFDGKPSGTVLVGGHEGTVLPLGKGPDDALGELVLASGDGRTFVVRIDAAKQADLDAVRADVAALLGSIVTRE